MVNPHGGLTSLICLKEILFYMIVFWFTKVRFFVIHYPAIEKSGTIVVVARNKLIGKLSEDDFSRILRDL